MKDRHAEPQQNGPYSRRRFNPSNDPIWPLLPSFLYRYFTDHKTEAQKGWESCLTTHSSCPLWNRKATCKERLPCKATGSSFNTRERKPETPR